MIIAIDGPAGAGKSTTARRLALKLGFLYLDTGAMYRAVALAFLRSGVRPTEHGAADVLSSLNLDVVQTDAGMEVFLNGEDVTEAIRSPEVGLMASRVSALAPVRERMVEAQRQIARARDTDGVGVVVEGRDIGTVVFPEAPVKIFLVASPAERARRRKLELDARGTSLPLDQVQAEMEQRDRQDAERNLAPLCKADDAIEVDTTGLSIDAQVNLIFDIVKERSGKTQV